MIKLTDILNEDCWKGYKQIGMKTKNGKQVPNCVPESVDTDESFISPNTKLKGTPKPKDAIDKNLDEYSGGSYEFTGLGSSNYGGAIDLGKNKKIKGTPKPKDAIDRNLNEASMTVSIANIVDELFPKEFFWVYNPKDKERIKSVIGDLVRTLNTFYKKQGIKVRFTDSNIKMKMYSKENKSMNEVGLWTIDKYMTQSSLVPGRFQTIRNDKEREKKRAVEKDLAYHLNTFWKKWKIPYRIDLSKKSYPNRNEDLRKWFGKGKTGSTDGGGWDRYSSTGKKLGKCGDGEEGDAYAACLSKEKATKLGPKGRASFVNRKRADQKKAGDKEKGGNRTKGKTPTFSKTGA